MGGHGYIRAHGMEQYIRDVRITQIYDGTNGIQALDLVRRKLTDGRLTRSFITPIRAFLSTTADDPRMREFTQPVVEALASFERIAARIAELADGDPEEAAAAATEFLRQFGLVALAAAWARMAAAALPNVDAPDSRILSRQALHGALLCPASAAPGRRARAVDHRGWSVVARIRADGILRKMMQHAIFRQSCAQASCCLFGLSAGGARGTILSGQIHSFNRPLCSGRRNGCVARLIGQKLAECWKIAMPVENHLGAGGMIATNIAILPASASRQQNHSARLCFSS